MKYVFGGIFLALFVILGVSLAWDVIVRWHKRRQKAGWDKARSKAQWVPRTSTKDGWVVTEILRVARYRGKTEDLASQEIGRVIAESPEVLILVEIDKALARDRVFYLNTLELR